MAHRLLVVLLGLTAVLGCRIERRVPAGAASESDRVRDVVTAYYRALSAGDRDGFLALFAERGTVAGPAADPHSASEYWTSVGPRLAAGVRPAEPRAARVQIRVQGLLATAWAVTDWRPPEAAASGRPERALFFLMRDGRVWRLVTVGIDDTL
jgi:ketosteroid isomerase-like protein